MELLIWTVNLDSLLFKYDSSYKKAKEKFQESFREKLEAGDEFSKEETNHGILIGFYHAFNTFKHNMEIFDFSRGEIIDDSLFCYSWKSTGKKPTGKKSRQLDDRILKFEIYNYFLLDKNVYMTLYDARFFLIKGY